VHFPPSIVGHIEMPSLDLKASGHSSHLLATRFGLQIEESLATPHLTSTKPKAQPSNITPHLPLKHYKAHKTASKSAQNSSTHQKDPQSRNPPAGGKSKRQGRSSLSARKPIATQQPFRQSRRRSQAGIPGRECQRRRRRAKLSESGYLRRSGWVSASVTCVTWFVCCSHM
jgi:hypothetical protein